MTFRQATRAYDELLSRRQAGQLTPEQFTAAVAELRVQDETGGWWQMDATTGGWLRWDGAVWVPDLPPAPQRTSRPEQQDSGAKGTWDELKRRTLSPGEFLRETKQTPLMQRSRRWWDALAIFGGVVGAALWFFYSSIRAGDGEGYDLITPIIMMAIPAFMVLFRERIDRWLLPVQKYRQHIPRLVLIGAGMAAPLAVSWFLYGLGGLREYDYLRVSLVAGTAVAYLILRTPRVSSRSPRT